MLSGASTGQRDPPKRPNNQLPGPRHGCIDRVLSTWAKLIAARLLQALRQAKRALAVQLCTTPTPANIIRQTDGYGNQVRHVWACALRLHAPLFVLLALPPSHDVYHQPEWTTSPPFPSTKARSSPTKVQRERWTPADPNRRVCTRFRSLVMVTHSVGFSAGGRLGGTFVPPFLPPSLFLGTRLG